MQNDRFDAIPIPEELNHAVRDGIKEGLRQRKTLHRKRTFSCYSAVAAGILAALCAGVLLVHALLCAAVCGIPVIDNINERNLHILSDR